MCAIETTPAITTPRLRLRKPERRDAPTLAKLLNDFDLARMTSRIPHPYGIEDAEAFLDRQAQVDWRRDGVFMVEHPDQGLIGTLGFDTRDDGALEVGYWIGRPFWGCGFATEAARAGLNWAHKAWSRRFVVAGHFADNPASGEVLCKAGFLYTGEVRPTPSMARGQCVPARMMVWLA